MMSVWIRERVLKSDVRVECRDAAASENKPTRRLRRGASMLLLVESRRYCRDVRVRLESNRE